MTNKLFFLQRSNKNLYTNRERSLLSEQPPALGCISISANLVLCWLWIYWPLADFKHFCGHLSSNMVGCICMYLVASFGGSHPPFLLVKPPWKPSEIPESGQQTSKCLPVKSTMGLFENRVPLNPLDSEICSKSIDTQSPAKCPAPGDGLLARLVTWLVPSTVGFAPSADWVEAVLWLSPAGARTGDILPCGKMWELPYYKDGNLMGFHTCLLGDFMPLGIIGWFKMI